MKKVFVVFALLFSFQAIYAQKNNHNDNHNDPVPLTSKPIVRDTLPEEKLWETCVNKFDYIEKDSSISNSIRRIAEFDGIKFQLRLGTGNLSVVEKWEFRQITSPHGLVVLYIFTVQGNKKTILSLRKMEGYKEIRFFILPNGLQSQSMIGYIPDNVKNKDITKISINF